MTILYISEFNTFGKSHEGTKLEAAPLPAVAHQSVAISSTSAQSQPLKGAYVRLISTTTCFVLVGSNPVATTAALRLTADSPEYFTVTPGDRIAVIQG